MNEEIYYDTISEDDYLPYFREGEKSHKDGQFDGIIKMGRAETNGIWHRENKIYCPTLEHYDDNTILIKDGLFYITYDGDIFPDCDLSYNVMNKGKYKLGNIDNFEEVIEKLEFDD